MVTLVHARAHEQMIQVQYCKQLLGNWNFSIWLTLGQNCNVVWVLGGYLDLKVTTVSEHCKNLSIRSVTPNLIGKVASVAFWYKRYHFF